MKWQPLKAGRIVSSKPKDKRRRRPHLETLEQREMLATDVTTYHFDNTSTGQNLSETTLNPSNVNSSQFGKLATVPLDGQVYAEPLYVAGVQIASGPNQGSHNIVFAATEHDSLYAIDAQSGNVLWHDSFIDPAAGVATVPSGDVFSDDISPEYGITSTPVIDSNTNTLFVVANTKEVRGDGVHYVYRMHAIDLATGAEKFGGPAVIGDTLVNGTSYTYISGPSVNGSGSGSVNGKITFNALWQLQRAGLTLANDTVYVAFGSHSDLGQTHGWVIGFDANTLAMNTAFNTTPNGTLGTIWQSGNSITVDDQGNLYVTTGNGSFDTTLDANGFPINHDYGQSVVKLAVDPNSSAANQNSNGWGLKVVDYFTPYNQQTLDDQNLDLSGGVALLSDRDGSAQHPHLLVAAGKQGRIYLIDRDNMGKFDPNGDHVVQEVDHLITNSFDTPAHLNDNLYYAGAGDTIRAITISNGVLSTSYWSQSEDNFGFPGATPSISSDGGVDGIVWAVDKGSNQLRAYNAGGLDDELYNSDQAGTRDQLGSAVKFSVPTVADGQVFVGTANSLTIYGLLNGPGAATISGAGASLTGNAYAKLSNVVTATFTSGDGSSPATDFNALIAWGDGTTSDGVITKSGATYSVSGSHAYSEASVYAIVVTVSGNRATANISAAATIQQELMPDGSRGTANQQWIEAMFRDVLGRSTDAAGLAAFSYMLDHGVSRYTAASLITHSAEYYANLVKSLYREYLGRDADPAGLQNWVSELQQGLTDEQLEANFIGSQEFYEHSGGTAWDWVEALYVHLLDRLPDAAGENGWVLALAHGASRTQVALGFATSPEREARRVQDDYFRYLGRSAGPSEVNGWVAAFQYGVTNEDVVTGFVASQEYFQRKTASY